MFNSTKVIILIFVFFWGSHTNCLSQSIGNQKKDFEAKLAKALNLQLVNKDSDYLYCPRLKIIGDTVVGFWSRFSFIDNQIHRYYFIQSLSNPVHKIKFDNAKLSSLLVSMIDYYRNGCLYFGRYQGTAMQTLCSDGTLTNYFDRKKDDDLRKRKDYLNKVIIYKDQAALSDGTGIYLYNIATQKLLWKYTFQNYDGVLFRSIFGNKLIMSLDLKGMVKVICYDLDRHEVVWTKDIIGNNTNISLYSKWGPAYPPPYPLFSDHNNVIIPGSVSCYLINMDSGTVADSVRWHSYSKDEEISNFKIENNKLYITNLNDDEIGLCCIDIKTNKTIWNVKNASLYGIYKNYIIGYNPDGNGTYLIIDKNTGVVKDEITKPDRSQPGFFFLDDYIFINHNAIYK